MPLPGDSGTISVVHGPPTAGMYRIAKLPPLLASANIKINQYRKERKVQQDLGSQKVRQNTSEFGMSEV